MQKNDYLLGKFGVDTAENEPLRARLRARLDIGANRSSDANPHHTGVGGQRRYACKRGRGVGR